MLELPGERFPELAARGVLPRLLFERRLPLRVDLLRRVVKSLTPKSAAAPAPPAPPYVRSVGRAETVRRDLLRATDDFRRRDVGALKSNGAGPSSTTSTSRKLGAGLLPRPLNSAARRDARRDARRVARCLAADRREELRDLREPLREVLERREPLREPLREDLDRRELLREVLDRREPFREPLREARDRREPLREDLDLEAFREARRLAARRAEDRGIYYLGTRNVIRGMGWSVVGVWWGMVGVWW